MGCPIISCGAGKDAFDDVAALVQPVHEVVVFGSGDAVAFGLGNAPNALLESNGSQE